MLEPFAGPSSILLTDGEEHLRARRLVLPPFHGERMEARRAEIARLAAAEVDGWPTGEPIRTLPRMQALTLDVILGVVLGAPDARLREAIRGALDLAQSLARLMVLSVVPPGTPPWRRFDRAVARLDALLLEAIRSRPGDGGAVIDELIAAGGTEGELRDQVVTLLAAGHETTAGSLAWACERLARHPEVQDRLREDGEAYLEATVKEVLRTRPVLSITPRKAAVPYELGGYTLPPGTHVTPCVYLAHRRPELWPEPTAFRPERFLGARNPPGWLPVRRRDPPLRGRRLRDHGAARGAARGRGAPPARARPAGGRADAPPRRDALAVARRARHRDVPALTSAGNERRDEPVPGPCAPL